MVTVSRVRNFVAAIHCEIPRNFVAFNAENEVIKTEKSLQKPGHGELEGRRPAK